MGMPNITRLSDHLWVGGDLDHKAVGGAKIELKRWLALGISDIMDLRAEWSDEHWILESCSAELRYHHLGAMDQGLPLPSSWFAAGVQIAQTVCGRGGNLLVHCHLGVNRAPSMAMAILSATMSLDPIEALDHIRRTRPIAHAAYAESALEWWLDQREDTDAVRHHYRLRLADWRLAHPLDDELVVAQVRDGRRQRHERGEDASAKAAMTTPTRNRLSR